MFIFFFVTLSVKCYGAYSPEISGHKVVVKEFGTYKLATKKQVYSTPNTTAGYTSKVETAELIMQDHKLKLEKGTIFGVRIEIQGGYPGEVISFKVKYEHPPITKPNGTISRGFTQNKRVKFKETAADYGALYSLTEDYELVPGTWVFSIISDGTIVVRKEFELVE